MKELNTVDHHQGAVAPRLERGTCAMTEKRLIGECVALGKYGCCCYVYDKEVCGKPCSGQDKDCKHFFRVARWRNAKCAN